MSRFSKEILAECTFECLASSTISRYFYKVKETALRSGFVDDLKADEKLIVTVLNEAYDLCNEISINLNRTQTEFELALILACLDEVPNNQINQFIFDISEDNKIISIWLTGIG